MVVLSTNQKITNYQDTESGPQEENLPANPLNGQKFYQYDDDDNIVAIFDCVDGQWIERKYDYKALHVKFLSALATDLGTVKAGTINGVTINGSEFNNAFTYTESGVTYTGTTTMKDGNVVISRTGSDGSSWTTKVDRQLGFEDSYKSGSTAPARTTRLGQGQLYMVESGVGGYLPAAALNSSSWVNLPYASGFTTAESNPCQYRVFYQIDGSKLIRFRGQFQPTSGTLTTAGTYPFGQGTLPAAIRPSKTEFAYAAVNNGTGGRLAVTPAGSFILHAAQSGNSYCSISGMSYLID